MVNVKMDPRLKKALEQFAKQQGINLSALIRQTMIKTLQEHDINWRDEDPAE